MTKRISLNEEQKSFLIQSFHLLNKKNEKLKQLLPCFKKRYPTITASYRQLKYIINNSLVDNYTQISNISKQIDVVKPIITKKQNKNYNNKKHYSKNKDEINKKKREKYQSTNIAG